MNSPRRRRDRRDGQEKDFLCIRFLRPLRLCGETISRAHVPAAEMTARARAHKRAMNAVIAASVARTMVKRGMRNGRRAGR
jgi:hypothetical protein